MKIIGFDVGQKTIGVAVSDAFGWTAQGLTTINWDEADYSTMDHQLQEIITDHEIEKAVVGLPKHMNGTIGERGQASQTFAKYVEEKFKIPVILWDERLTTVAANRVLLEADLSRKKRKKVIDKMAAVFILQGFLNQK